jgi:hypothetical protein
LLDQYLIPSTAKVVLVMGEQASRRLAAIRPNAKLSAIQGHQDLFGRHVHGYAEYTDTDGDVSRVLIARFILFF